MSLPTWVSLQTGVNVRHHALLLILVQPSLHVKPPQGKHHICIWIYRFENQHVQTCRSKAFLILPPPPPVMPLTCCFTHIGVSIRICTFSIRRGWGRVSRTLLCWSELWRPSSQVTWKHPCGLSTPCVFQLTCPYSGRGGTSHQWWVGV